MTHIRSSIGQKKFVYAVLKRNKSPREMYRIYRAVEKAIGYKPKHRKVRRTTKKRYTKRHSY